MPSHWEAGAIIVLGNVPFRTCQQRPQHLARTLARACPVVYVNPNRSFLQRWARPPVEVESAPDGAGPLVLEAPAGLPGARTIPFLNSVNCWLSLRRVRDFLRDRLPRVWAVIATFPDQWEFVRLLPAQVPVLYDVMDDFTLFLRPRQAPRYHMWHRSLIARSACVLTSSRVLFRRHSAPAGAWSASATAFRPH